MFDKCRYKEIMGRIEYGRRNNKKEQGTFDIKRFNRRQLYTPAFFQGQEQGGKLRIKINKGKVEEGRGGGGGIF